MNLLNVTLEGRVKTQLFALMNPSADGLGQIPVCERVSHPRHDQQEVEGTRHHRSFFLMARHTTVEGRERAQEGDSAWLESVRASVSTGNRRRTVSPAVGRRWTRSVTWSVLS